MQPTACADNESVLGLSEVCVGLLPHDRLFAQEDAGAGASAARHEQHVQDREDLFGDRARAKGKPQDDEDDAADFT